MKYHSGGQHNIAWCVLDVLDKCDNLVAKDISINTIDFLIRGLMVNEYDVFVGKDEQELLLEAVKENKYSHAVIISTGTYLRTSEKLFKEVENICQQDFFIAGHVLNRGDFYLELHKQFYIMNLKDYQELGCPDIEEGAWFVDDPHEEFEPNITEFSDGGDEVIESMSIGTNKKVYTSKLHGWNILKLALENNKKTIDVGQRIRVAKHYLYHEYEHVFINQYPKIFHLQLFAHNVVAPWNSDRVYKTLPFDGPVEQYITLGTGLNWIRNLTMIGYTDDTRVVFTDINHNCLRFMKELVTTWDGVDYDQFYHSFEQFFPNGVPDFVFKTLTAKEEFEEFKKFFDDWPSTWNKVKKLNFDYKLIDYMADYDLTWIDPNKKTLMNFSDLFNHSPLIPFQSVKFRIGAENRLINNLNNINPDIVAIFTTRSATGYKSYDDTWNDDSIAFVGKIKDFKLTNIGDLKPLPWHEHDWKPFGRRPLGL